MAHKDGQKKPDHFKGYKVYEPGDPLDGTYDLVLSCHDCLAELGLLPNATGLTQTQLDKVQFVFTWDAQEYFQTRGFKDPPERCKHHFKLKQQATRHDNVNTTSSSRHTQPVNNDGTQKPHL